MLPISLPLALSTSGTERRFAVVPDSDRMKSNIRIEKKTDGTLLMERTIYLPEIADSRLVLDFVPASTGDAQIITGFGGICLTPEGQARVKPVLRRDGQIIAEGLPLYTGEYFIWSHEIGGKMKIRPPKQAGIIMSISFDALSVSVERLTKLKNELNNLSVDLINEDSTREQYLGRYAAILANTFLSRKNTAIQQTTDLLYTRRNYATSIFPTLIYVFPINVKSDSKPKYLIHPSWNIDASTQTGFMYKQDSEPSNSYSLSSDFGGFSAKLYMYGASFNEGLIFEDWQDTPGGNLI